MTQTLVELSISTDAASRVVEAATSCAPASLGPRRTSSTHEFYRYPARFPADLARTVIEAFTSRGQVVLDPFVGGMGVSFPHVCIG
ncbi:MAG: DNA methyltransferase, partial [Gammaproteobacteria bacterium]